MAEETNADNIVFKVEKNQLCRFISHQFFNTNGTFDDLVGRDNDFIFNKIKEEIIPRSQGR